MGVDEDSNARYLSSGLCPTKGEADPLHPFVVVRAHAGPRAQLAFASADVFQARP